MRRCAALSLLVVLILAGCKATPTTAPVAGVPWSDYSPTVQTGIDASAAAKDCPALQTAFNQADANGAATMTRTGHNNAALMAYIDDKMRGAGCY